MWKSAHKMLLLCKELLPDGKLFAYGNGGTLDLNAVVCQLYEKYFKEKVLYSSTAEQDNGQQLQRLLEVHSNQPDTVVPTPDDVWIFGYGSLVWKADFPYIDRRRGFICGYQRRFYQHSIDHRGTPVKPGRVVTLLPTGVHEDRVYGVAYRIAAEQKGDVLQHLDYREKNGYERCKLQFQEFPETLGTHFDVIMYVATHTNESYAGQVWQLPRIADQIFTSAGPSGPNREYLFNLAHAMRVLFPGVEDEHLFELEREVLKRVEGVQTPTLERALKKEIKDILVKDDKQLDAQDDNKVAEAVQEFHMLNNYCTKPGWREALLTKEWLPNTYS